MHVKTSVVGWAIYAALAAYIAAAAWVRRENSVRWGRWLGGLAGAVLLLVLVERTLRMNRAPLQDMFEVFLCMAACVAPFSRLCRAFSAREPGSAPSGDTGEALDYVLGAALLIPVGFIFPETPRLLPPALRSPLFIPHVTVYLVSYLLLTRAAWRAFPVAWGGMNETSARARERETHRLLCAGYPLLTLGLVLGAWWGKLAWGDFWNWDPKELWALATWLIYTAWLHDRAADGGRSPRRMAAWAIAGWICIVLTMTWVNLARIFSGLHSYAR
ncbi:MAG: cytochrome c biogenesis protein CcsA [Kiritimatiellae bacterium]|nr:cytochrome c biogenesis protein CcsA [Kiritimatiellia bacterium]